MTRTAGEPSSKSSRPQKLKVHHTSEPAPRQLYFPARSTTVRTYGKGKARRSLPSKTPDQSTLTQIGWIPSTYQEDEDDMEGLTDLITDDEDDDAQKPKGKETARRSSKRRRTTGDLNPAHKSTAGSSFHTQTLTQMPSFTSGQQPDDEELEEDFKLDDHSDEHKLAANTADKGRKSEAPSPLQETKERAPTPPPQKGALPPSQGTTPPTVTQTPRKQIIERAVIPSSQPSPFTPNLGISERYWSRLDQTPLRERSTNVDAPTPTVSRKRPRTLEIADSWSTVNGGMSSSPSKGKSQRTPLKEMSLGDVAERSIILGETPVRSDEQTIMDEADEVEVTSEPRAEPQEDKSTRPAGDIISDSEDDYDFGLENDNEANDEAPGTPTPAARVHTRKSAETLAQETGVITRSSPKPSTLSPERRATQRNATPVPTPEDVQPEPETPSPSPLRRTSMSSAVEADKGTPLSSPQKTSPALPPHQRIESTHRSQALLDVSHSQNVSPAVPVSQLGFRYKSQAFESQRVPFERIQRLGPQTDRSDIIISIHPQQVEQIVEGHKTHEFRNYRIPQTVGRIWIYVTRPACALKYMATISVAKQPGDISHEDPGIGNVEFNEGKGSQFAYELKQIYELNNPVSLARMKENGWVEEAPAKYVYIPPAVLGELMANLRRAIFVEPGEPQSSQVDMTESQEVDLQLRSDIAHSTHGGHAGSSPPQSQRREARGNANTIPSSQRNDNERLNSSPPHPTVAANNKPVFAKPSVPASRSQRSVRWAGNSPVEGRAQPASQRGEGYTVPPSQATTASAPSSPSQWLPSYRGQPILISSQSQPSIPVSPPTKAAPSGPPQIARGSSGLISDIENLGEDHAIVGDSPVRRHKNSTQGSPAVLGSSQGALASGIGEPDSLLDDWRVRQPPDIVWDSDGEIE